MTTTATVRTVDHLAAAMALARLRDRDTGQEGFRAAARLIGQSLAIAALDDVPTTEATVESPLAPAETKRPSVPIVAVPVLRAGLGLLHGVEDVIPDVRVGMIGLERDEDTLEPTEYYRKTPPLDDAWILLLEPMLATGGSASAAAQALDAEGAAGITVLSVVGTQQGIDRIADENPGIRFVVASIDPELNDDAFIVPGLGDFGDRLFGTVE
ncbi:MAG: uracil phosphoribosyltransferase [Nitriliruptorales bacterium]|nr:uracil phosphoribosyltransferase [Nitriliruptorales bacterium]